MVNVLIFFFLLMSLGPKKAVRWFLQLAKNVVPLELRVPGAAFTWLMPSPPPTALRPGPSAKDGDKNTAMVVPPP